jgi:peptidoglycan/LPS O-acetylase OafA/YrhL
MAETKREMPRVGWLDGLRGLAAMQVVFMHYVFAFLPTVALGYPLDIADIWWRGLVTLPLVFAYDGSSAVYLFFIMSGVVLTQAFTVQPLAFLPAVTRRVVRLGLPMAAAVVVAAALFALLPEAHVIAGEQSGSPAFRDIGPHEISVAAVFHQIAFEGLLTGFDGWSLLPGWATRVMGLMPRARGFNTPVWTLHIEFYGSLLVILLVTVRASTSRTTYRTICFILACAFALSPLCLFIIGHLADGRLRPPVRRPWQAVFGAVLLGSGILLCTVRTVDPISILWGLLPQPPLGIQGDNAILQKMIGAVLIFFGLSLLPVLQRHLERPSMRFLGKLSFSLYLTHYPLLYTCFAACFIVLEGSLPYGASVAIVSVVGIAASLAIAVLFERWIDRPAIMLSRLVGRSRRRTPTSGTLAAVSDTA